MNKILEHTDQLNKLIKNYQSNNLHSSILFYGPKGLGKRSTINQFIIKSFKNNFDEKNYLHHYNLFNNNTHPNILLIEKEIDKKSNKFKSTITIDQIRKVKKFINESVSISKFSKIVIIDSADDLNLNSANSLLKSLEEPRKNTYIFLVSHQISSLLPTIRSRCLKVRFNKLVYNNFENIIKTLFPNISDNEINLYYDLTNGSPGQAISIIQENMIDVFDLTLETLNYNKLDDFKIQLTEILSQYDNEKFKTYLSLLKSILILSINIKNPSYKTNQYLVNKFNSLDKLSNNLSKDNIIDRFNFLSNNETDLFKYNLDKKLFMLKFLTY